MHRGGGVHSFGWTGAASQLNFSLRDSRQSNVVNSAHYTTTNCMAPATRRSHTPCPRAVLNRKKKNLFRNMVFSKTTACSSYVQPWLVEIGGWRLVEIAGWQLAVGGWRRLAAVGGSWQLVMGGWWRLAAVDGWWLVAVGGWRRLAVGGSWRLAVGGPLGRSLTKKNLVP